MTFKNYQGKGPKVHLKSYIAPSADIVGDVEISAGCGIWFGTVIRGDIAPVRIGENSNVQDNATIHTSKDLPVKIGSHVTIGHNAVVHGCIVEDNVLIGMNAVILDGAKIGKGAIIGAGCLIGENKIIPPRVLVVGIPGKIVKELDEEREQGTVEHALMYRKLMEKYLEEE